MAVLRLWRDLRSSLLFAGSFAAVGPFHGGIAGNSYLLARWNPEVPAKVVMVPGEFFTGAMSRPVFGHDSVESACLSNGPVA